MDCAEFREQYQMLLDERRADPLAPELLRHATACSSCAVFVRAMSGLDEALRASPRVLPEELLLRELAAIPLRELRSKTSLKLFIARGIALTMAAGVTRMLGTTFLSPEGDYWLRLFVMTAGLSYFSLTVLRRNRIAFSSE